MNIKKMMKQAQQMQSEMAKAQKELKQREITGSAGGGLIEVKVDGEKNILDIAIKKEVVNSDEIEILQDLIMVATNNAFKQVDELTEETMKKITKGKDLPGI